MPIKSAYSTRKITDDAVNLRKEQERRERFERLERKKAEASTRERLAARKRQQEDALKKSMQKIDALTHEAFIAAGEARYQLSTKLRLTKRERTLLEGHGFSIRSIGQELEALNVSLEEFYESISLRTEVVDGRLELLNRFADLLNLEYSNYSDTASPTTYELPVEERPTSRRPSSKSLIFDQITGYLNLRPLHICKTDPNNGYITFSKRDTIAPIETQLHAVKVARSIGLAVLDYYADEGSIPLSAFLPDPIQDQLTKKFKNWLPNIQIDCGAMRDLFENLSPTIKAWRQFEHHQRVWLKDIKADLLKWCDTKLSSKDPQDSFWVISWWGELLADLHPSSSTSKQLAWLADINSQQWISEISSQLESAAKKEKREISYTLGSDSDEIQSEVVALIRYLNALEYRTDWRPYSKTLKISWQT